MAVTALLCTFSLVLSEPGSSLPLPGPSRYVALLAAFIAVSVLLESVFHISPAIDAVLDTARTASADRTLPLQPSAAFAYLALVIILVSSSSDYIRSATDVFVSCLCFLTMTLIIESLFGVIGLFGLSAGDLIPPMVLACLVLLTVVVSIRQSEHGQGSRAMVPRKAAPQSRHRRSRSQIVDRSGCRRDSPVDAQMRRNHPVLWGNDT